MSHVATGAEVRRAFLEFFRERGHTVVPSASLIPVDPTLLLTNAGMVPFKRYFLGEERPSYRTAASVQKCVRTVDIDIVGTTARHLSFFEMLGNFSFGDYFKAGAIPYAYELVTEGFGLDPERLWYTVHEGDDEAAEIWIDGVGIPADRLQRRDRDNFWQMGVAGPAGYASEIFFDRGPEYGPDGGPVVDEERFTEIWNLVFMEFVQDEPYHVVGDLPEKNIDTGAGLERVATVIQGVDNVFETDLVRPVIAAAEAATGVAYGAADSSDVVLRLMADHGRAMTFLIGDGVAPANEGRGYVLRRIIRRAVRHAWALGAEEAVTPRLVGATVDIMGDAYPALAGARDGIVEMAGREERRFRRTLESGYAMLDDAVADLGEGGVVDGSVAFRLHDTYGFPVELTEEIASERGLSLDRAGFEAEMAAQRERARAAWRGAHDEASPVYLALFDEAGPTEFLGYEHVEGTGRILAMLRDGEHVKEAAEGDDVEVFVDRSPFYAEAGGQVGDTGSIATETGRLRVSDTQFAVQGLNGHRATVTTGTVRVGQDARLAVDADRRERIRKSHTGTHLLHYALRDVLGSHVQQAGSLVEAGRLRFDFSHFGALSEEELFDVERETNERIIENARVRSLEVSRHEAEDMGALAFFGDKYGDRVRVVEAGSFSRELCGGTHVPSTGQVGPLVLLGESSIGSNMRRVEAYTGATAYGYVSDLRRTLHDTAAALRSPPDRVVDAAAALVERSKAQEERIEAFEAQARSGVAGRLADGAEAVDGASVVVAEVEPGTAPDDLRALALQVRDRLGSGIAVLGARRDGKAGLIAAVSRDVAASGVAAGDLLAGPARIVGGGGSRDPELSQAGGPNGDRLPEALEEARRVVIEALRSR